MADVRKTVEIALNVVGMDASKIKVISSTFAKVATSVDQATSSINKFKGLLESLKAPASLDKVVASLKQLNGTDVSGVVNKLRSLNTSLIALEKRGGISAFKTFAQDVDRMKSAFTAASTSMGSMNEKIKNTGQYAQSTGLKLRTFSDKVKTVLTFRLISDALVNLKLAITNGVTAIVEYDQALKDLQAITGATALEVAQMGIKIREVASTTKFSASEVAEGMRTIGQAGFSAGEAVQTMQAVSDLATGTLSTMSTTVDLVTTAMRVFGIEASRSGEIADVFANAVNGSKLTVDKLRTAMNYIGPIAKSAGVSFKELSASMMTLANSGLRASTIGTGLRRVFSELVDPSKKLKQAADNVGISLKELDPRSTKLSKVVSNLGIVVNDAQLAFDLFGKRGAAAVLALSNSDSVFDSMLDSVNRTGTAAWQASIQMEGLAVSFKNLKDKLGLLAITLGRGGIAVALKVLIDLGRSLTDTLIFLADSTIGKVVIQLTILASTVVILGAAFGGLKSILATNFFVSIIAGGKQASLALLLMIKNIKATSLALKAFVFTNPIIALVAAVAAVTVGLIAMFEVMDNSEEQARKVQLLADEYKNLDNALKNYRVDTANFAEDSEEHLQANKKLKNELFEVSLSMDDLSGAAINAYNSIHPLTGEILDGGEALILYGEAVQKIQFAKLIEAANLTTQAFKENTDWISTTISGLKTFGTELALLYSDTTLLQMYKMNQQARDFSVAINNGAKSVSEIKDYLDGLTPIEQKLGINKNIKENYDKVQESAKLLLAELFKTERINLGSTISEIEKIAGVSGASKEVVEALTLQFSRLSEVSKKTAKNIFEAWEQNKEALVSYLDEFENRGGNLSQGQKDDIAAINETKNAYVDNYNTLKELRDEELKSAGKDEEAKIEIYKEYHTKFNTLTKEAHDYIRTASKTTTAQRIKGFKEVTDAFRKEQKIIIAETVAGTNKRAEALAQSQLKYEAAIKKFTDDSFKTDPTDIDAYKENLARRQVAHAKHLAQIQANETASIITQEEGELQKAQATLNFYKTSSDLASAYFAEVSKEDNPEQYQKRLKIKLSAEKKFYSELEKFSEFKLKAAISKQKKDIKDVDLDVAARTREAKKQIVALQLEAAQGSITADKASRASAVIRIQNISENSEAYRELLSSIPDEESKEYKETLAKLNSLDVQRLQILASESAANKKLADELRKVTNERALLEAEKAKKSGVSVGDTEIDIIKRNFEEEQRISDLRIQHKTEELVELRAIRESDNADVIAKENEIMTLRIANETAVFEYRKALAAQRLVLATEEWELGRMSAEEYQNVVNTAYETTAISFEEHADKTKEVSGNLWDNFINGVQDSMKEVKSLNQIMDEMGGAVLGNLVNGIDSAFQSFLDGTKSAKEAFKDFAKQFIADMLKMIAKQILLNALKTVFSTGGEVGSTTVQTKATGGTIYGKSPTATADNIPIWATAGEFMQPVSAVKRYGLEFMESVRRGTYKIGQSMQKFAHGGSIRTPNRNMVQRLATGGTVEPANVNVATGDTNLKVVNVIDERYLENSLNSVHGEKTMFNWITNHQNTLKGILR